MMARVAYREIVEGLKAGDRKAIRDLVAAYQDRLVSEGISTFRLRAEDAEEAASDTLLVAVQKCGTFTFKRSDMDFHFWLMTIFRNRVRDILRQQSLFEGSLAMFGDLPDNDGEYSPAERQVVKAMVRRYEEEVREEESGEGSGAQGGRKDGAPSRLQIISTVLDEMEAWERVLLRCRALDVPYEQIAGYTGKPAKTLKVYHARVRKKMMKRLTEFYPELAPDEKGRA